MRSKQTMTIVILNFRTPEITINCLKTIAAEVQTTPGIHVILIDNASGDDSVPLIKAAILENHWSASWLEFRPIDTNLGFAGGNNLILREQLSLASPPEYLLLLNSDTLVHQGCLATCLKLMEEDSKIGALSCMLRNRDGSVQNVCRKFPHPLRESLRALGLPWIMPKLFGWADLEDRGWDREKISRDVDWISGAFFLARTEMLRKTGLMDEGFFFLGEDCEWCFRIWKNGWRIRFDPSAEITHLGGASSDSTRVRNRTKDLYTWRARFKVQEKCYGLLAKVWIHSLYLISFGLRKYWMMATGKTGQIAYEGISEGFDQLLHLNEKSGSDQLSSKAS